ncbi:hypothetical protein JOM56_014043 [Amanita muscaria]
MATTSVSFLRPRFKTGLTLEKNLAFIHVALNSATATRFPILQSVFVSIERILAIAQKVNMNKFEFMKLAEDSLMLMVAISVKLMDRQEIDQSLKGNIEELLKALQWILSYGETRAALELQNPLTEIYLAIRDSDAIFSSSLEVERCIRLFGFQSLLDFRDETLQLMEQCIENGSFSITTTNMNNIIPFGNCQKHETSQDKTEQSVEPVKNSTSSTTTNTDSDYTTENTISFENSQEDGTSLTSQDCGSVVERFGLNTSGFRRRRLWTNEYVRTE